MTTVLIKVIFGASGDLRNMQTILTPPFSNIVIGGIWPSSFFKNRN